MRTLKLSKTCRASLIVSTLLVALAGCQKQEAGTAEQAGKEIGKDAPKVGQEVEMAGVRIQQSAKDEPAKDDHK